MGDSVVIKEVRGFLEGEIIKAKLESFDIPCILKQETARRLFGFYQNKLASVKLIVPLELKDKATKILNEQT